ncbi:MAG: sulfatase-like hydrolase/transferase [Verrucomicrobiota bacterium]
MSQHADEGGLSRRRLLQAAGIAAAGAAAAGTVAGASAAPAAATPPFKARGRLRRRPNFLILMVDEQRYAPTYESAELAAWRAANLKGQAALRSRGMEFTHHHIMSTACQPSRASIFTGQYPSLHGVSQTSGSAKASIETDLYWLDPTMVPTLGSWFRAAGYDTYWKGKWHISDTDLYQPGSYNPLPSYTDTGARDKYLEDIYLEAGILERYGFTGFIGPEPHGSNVLNSASSAGLGGQGRDQVFAEISVAQLEKLRSNENPWLMVASFLNPHDITLWGTFTLAAEATEQPGHMYLASQLVGSNVPRDLFTDVYRQSSTESLATKPDAQASYVGLYAAGFQPLVNDLAYHRFYYQLQKEVDQHIARLMATLAADRDMYENTIVIYLSDHGEVLGAHGGMFQKWHNSYDEMLRVPFIFHNPTLFPKAAESDVLTSHADLIPTMLGLAGLNERALARKLRATHTQVRRLVGRDLSGVLLGEDDPDDLRSQPVYFMTDDQIFRGAQNVSGLGLTYAPVVQPASVESVVAYLPTGADNGMERWKYVRYWDNPAIWTTPNVQDVLTIVPGLVDKPGTRVAVTTVKTPNPTDGQIAPPADQFEMYNLTADPAELTNLVGNADYSVQQAALAKILTAQRTAKRLEPVIMPWADGTAKQFPFVPTAS